MPKKLNKTREELLAEMEELRSRLDETEEVLRAIQNGEVDALVVTRPVGEQIFTLQGAEHPYRVLIETMNEGAAMLAPDHTIIYCNSSLAALLQVPLERVMGRQLEHYFRPADLPLLHRCLQCTTATCGGNEELTLVNGTGDEIPVLLSSCAVDIAGSPGVGVVVTDIRTRRHAEKTILRLNRLYAVLSGINHAVLHISDPDDIFREVCRVAVVLGGFRLAWVGLLENETGMVKVVAGSGETGYLDNIALSVDPEQPETVGSLACSIREGTYHICNDLLDTDSRRWRERAHAHGLYAAASMAIKQGGEVVGALTIYADEKNFFDSQQVELLQQMGSDISFTLDNIEAGVLRRKAEQALQRETVERLQAVEELRLKEQMLIHQSRQAALGEMIGNIAHQWRQPLNNLALLVQQPPLFYDLGQVDKEFLEGQSKKAMEYIHHMSSTIDDFRNFFKPDKEKVDFRVHEEVMRTLSLMEASLKGQEIAIQVIAQDDPVINGYPNEFSQVLLNILANARDALTERAVPNPKVVVTIGIERDRAIVTISDNAGGIADDIATRIFDPYFSTKGPHQGTGLGLFMSKTIVEKNMGGQLTVRNVADGAEFRIEV